MQCGQLSCVLPWLQAEAERFVTRPFLMGTHDAPQAGPSPLPAGAAQRAARADSAKKRATTSVFKPAQQCAPGSLSSPCLLLPASTGISGSGPAIVGLPACVHANG